MTPDQLLDLVPKDVAWLLKNGAFLCGSQAPSFKATGKPKEDSDWDLMVPIERWRRCGAYLARQHRDGHLELSVTGYGGLRVRREDGPWMDVWPDTLDLLTAHLKKLYPDQTPTFYSVETGFVSPMAPNFNFGGKTPDGREGWTLRLDPDGEHGR